MKMGHLHGYLGIVKLCLYVLGDAESMMTFRRSLVGLLSLEWHGPSKSMR